MPGVGAALALAASTLAVFGVFQNYGPESAVRRFHHAVATDGSDRSRLDQELSQVVMGSPESSATQQLAAFLSNVLASGSGYSIVKSERSPTQVDILAVYGHKTIVWVVIKARDRWRIDPYLTIQALRRLGYQ